MTAALHKPPNGPASPLNGERAGVRGENWAERSLWPLALKALALSAEGLLRITVQPHVQPSV
jgi:hypothetical protein